MIDLGAAAACLGSQTLSYEPGAGPFDPLFAPPERYLIPERASVPNALNGRILWAQHTPELFDSFSAGVVLAQLSLRNLRKEAGLKVPSQHRCALSAPFVPSSLASVAHAHEYLPLCAHTLLILVPYRTSLPSLNTAPHPSRTSIDLPPGAGGPGRRRGRLAAAPPQHRRRRLRAGGPGRRRLGAPGEAARADAGAAAARWGGVAAPLSQGQVSTGRVGSALPKEGLDWNAVRW